jgi:hypothetical protein
VLLGLVVVGARSAAAPAAATVPSILLLVFTQREQWCYSYYCFSYFDCGGVCRWFLYIYVDSSQWPTPFYCQGLIWFYLCYYQD